MSTGRSSRRLLAARAVPTLLLAQSRWSAFSGLGDRHAPESARSISGWIRNSVSATFDDAVARHPPPSGCTQPLRALGSEFQRRGEIGFGIALNLRPTAMIPDIDVEQVIRIWSDPLLSGIDQVLAVIGRARYRSTDLMSARRAPFRIHASDDAVQLGLFLAALKPLRKGRRIEEVARAISSMRREEVSRGNRSESGGIFRSPTTAFVLPIPGDL